MSQPDENRRRTIWATALILVLAAAMALPAFGGERHAANDDRNRDVERDTLRALFHDLRALEPIQVGPLTVVPLRSQDDTKRVSVSGHPSLLTAEIVGADPKQPRLKLKNPTSRTVLVTAGRIAYARSAEVVLAHDVVVPARGSATARALPGSFDEGTLTEGEALRWYPRWAPPELRETIVTDASSYDVKHFLGLFHAVVGEERNRIPALRDVLSSDWASKLDTQVAQVMHEARFRGENVVGFVSGLHGYPVMLQLFGSPELHRKNAPALLVSHGIRSAALKARADSLGIPLHKGEKASKAVLKATHELLATLREKSRKEAKQLDDITGIYGPGVLGRALWYRDRPVHVTAFPHDPYAPALWARSFLLPAKSLTPPVPQ
ncbi:MAG: hypothetical protein QNJ90_13040 [Planctomycetota bacterium]|nr:hypothetical protein [Planctomycetota bacterium]